MFACRLYLPASHHLSSLRVESNQRNQVIRPSLYSPTPIRRSFKSSVCCDLQQTYKKTPFAYQLFTPANPERAVDNDSLHLRHSIYFFLLLFLSFASASNCYKNFNDFGFAVSSNFQRQPKLTCTALVLPCCPFLQHNPLDNVLPSRSFEEPATSV